MNGGVVDLRAGERRALLDRRGAAREAQALREAALTALRLGDAATASRLVAESDRLDPPKEQADE